MSDKFFDFRTDVLFLLIGSNPLPNYVAASLLIREQGTLVLLHSQATATVAERLARRLRSERADLSTQLFTVPEADGPAIARRVTESVQQFERSYPRRTIGLNYTGGTKPMAAYSYQALSTMFPSGVFSYLDARTLSMVIDPGGGPAQRIPVERQVTLKLADIVEMHGYQIKRKRTTPLHAAIAAAIAQVHLAPEGLKQWRDWLDTWKGGATLPDSTRFPALTPAIQAFDAACGGKTSAEGVAQALGFQQLNQCGKYFIGGWLEDHTLDALSKTHRQMPLEDYASEILIRSSVRPDFDLDVAATIGYQLFAISCIATEQKSKAKEHLLEIFTRAGQLGGDEARFAAITFCDDTNVRDLQREVSEAWDAQGKIRVFGRSHIGDLPTHLLRWFREANQEAT